MLNTLILRFGKCSHSQSAEMQNSLFQCKIFALSLNLNWHVKWHLNNWKVLSFVWILKVNYLSYIIRICNHLLKWVHFKMKRRKRWCNNVHLFNLILLEYGAPSTDKYLFQFVEHCCEVLNSNFKTNYFIHICKSIKKFKKFCLAKK